MTEEFDPDATVVRAASGASDADFDQHATVVRTTAADTGAEAAVVEADPDATIVRPKRPDADAALDSEAGADAGAGIGLSADAADAGALSWPAPEVAGPDHRGDPVPDPEPAAYEAAQAAQAARPDQAAATSRSGLLRRAANTLPRIYGPRQVVPSAPPEPAVTKAGGVAASNPRAQLPSLARRDRRARLITLAGYAASVCIAGIGLWFVATLAFAG